MLLTLVLFQLVPIHYEYLRNEFSVQFHLKQKRSFA